MARAAGGGRKSNDAKTLPAAPVGEQLKEALPPEDLRDDVAVQLWQGQSQLLIERGVLTAGDLGTLLIYCNSYSLYLEAEKQICKEGLTVSSATGGLKKHPAINARQDALSMAIRNGSLLGLDPLSRTKLMGGGPGAGSGTNEFSEFD